MTFLHPVHSGHRALHSAPGVWTAPLTTLSDTMASTTCLLWERHLHIMTTLPALELASSTQQVNIKETISSYLGPLAGGASDIIGCSGSLIHGPTMESPSNLLLKSLGKSSRSCNHLEGVSAEKSQGWRSLLSVHSAHDPRGCRILKPSCSQGS